MGCRASGGVVQAAVSAAEPCPDGAHFPASISSQIRRRLMATTSRSTEGASCRAMSVSSQGGSS